MKSDRALLSGLLLLAIPFLAMAYMVWSNEMNFRNTPEYRIEITGYDPVNILTGHYLSFRYQWPKDVKTFCSRDGECQACFSGPPERPKIEFREKWDTQSCAASLALDSAFGVDNPQPSQKLTVYHISEIEAPILDNMLRERNGKFEVGILIYPDHSGQIKNLYINGEKLSKFFKPEK